MQTKEDKFKELIDGYKVVIFSDSKIDVINYFNSQDEWLINYNKKNVYTYIRWKYIWSVFKEEYNMNYNEIQAFIKDMLLIHFKLRGVTPRYICKD